jgi:hypothetical protein
MSFISGRLASFIGKGTDHNIDGDTCICLHQHFNQQESNPVKYGNTENTSCSAIPVAIDIDGEKADISHQAPRSKKGKQPAFPHQYTQKFINGVIGKPHEINNDTDYNGYQQGQYDS